MNDILTNRPWASVPEAVVEAPISAQAFRVWVAIQLHARPGGKSPFPGERRLAQMCGVSVPTIKRAISELVTSGHLSVERHRQSSGVFRGNSYTLRAPGITDDPRSVSPGITGDPSPGITGDPTEVDRNLSIAERQSLSGAIDPPKRRSPRPGDPLWDALTEVFGPAVTRNARSNRGKLVQSLLEAEVDPEWITRKSRDAWRKTMPDGATFTENALEKHYGLLIGPTRVTCPECGVGGGKHAEECSFVVTDDNVRTILRSVNGHAG